MVNLRHESIGPAGTSPIVPAELRCTSCGRVATHDLGNVTLYVPAVPARALAVALPDAWDGLFTSTIVDCPCGSVDAYEMTDRTRAQLEGLARAGTQDPAERRVRAAVPSLWDGFVPRRPSEGVRHLRSLAESRPAQGEGWRRLGNFLEQVGDLQGAVDAWIRAKADPEEVEAVMSLASAAWDEEEDDVALALAEECLVRACRGGPPRLGESLLRVVAHIVVELGHGRSLHAAWPGGEINGQHVINASTLRLDRASEDGLMDFLLGAEPFGVHFGPDGLDPDEGPTRLEHWTGASPAPAPSLHRPAAFRRDTMDRKKKRKAARKARKANRKR